MCLCTCSSSSRINGKPWVFLLQKKGWPSTFALAYSAVGVVYGDVGTSPLYVFSSTFTTGTPTETDVLGAMSIIFWTITLIVVVKYMLIVLLADDNGEGQNLAWTCPKVLVDNYRHEHTTQLQVPCVMLIMQQRTGCYLACNMHTDMLSFVLLSD